jgi:cytochrome c553
MQRFSILLFLLAVCAAFALVARSQEQTAGTAQKTVVKVPIKRTSTHSGQEMYMAYCAACHGKDGMGVGPAASALKQQPTDLTALAKNNNGKFPTAHFVSVMRFGVEVPAHGTSDMPIWGPLFGSLHSGDVSSRETMGGMHITAVRKYIESLQSK